MHHYYLTFSDGAKYADIARNLIHGIGYSSSFNFWGADNSSVILPGMPLSMAVFFKIFGVTDFAVIATSFFYFILTIVFVFLLTKKLFNSNLVASLSSLAVGLNYNLINYATSGASESPFIFEIVAASYFISLRKKWGTVLGLILLVLMYFTRPQAIIYILGLVIYYLFLNLHWKKATLYSLGTLTLGALAYFLFSRQVEIAVSQNLPGVAVSNSLRGGVQSEGLLTLFKKLFYNLYNFYKLLPQIMSPYLFALFMIGIFKWTKDKMQNSFKLATVFMVLATFFVTAITIPFFRYIHPIIPFVYIVAIATLSEIITNKKILIFLVIMFGIGQTLGVVFLDSRFEKQIHNVNKPPVYVLLSEKLKENTSPNQTIVTNLDTWGSWYGERKTVWFPLEPKQLIDEGLPVGRKISFDAVYLTSYLMDDQNYYMGDSWRLIFDNPEDPEKWVCSGCGEIRKEFVLGGVYSVNRDNNYERQDAKAVLLIKKH